MDTYSQDCWTDAQWTQIQEAVRDEAKQHRVAASFLPLSGGVPEDAQTVPLQTLNLRHDPANPGTDFLEVNDFDTRRLTTLSVRVSLGTSQVAQQDLSAAIVAFRRAANLIARAEDFLVLFMSTRQNAPLPGLNPALATGGDFFDGLFTTAVNRRQTVSMTAMAALPPPPGPGNGEPLVRAVSNAIGQLEANGHLGPFALVLNTRLFDVAHTPDPGSFVLPADRIKPLLDGPCREGGRPSSDCRLLRSSLLNWGAPTFRGVLVSPTEDRLDLVVASEIRARLLQITADASPRFIFRVSERFTLRIKQPTAVVAILA